METQIPKAYILSFPYRRTGMGGFDDTILISFRSRRPIKSLLKKSASGRHGTRSYRLYPGRYLVYQLERSNGGNLYGVVKVIILHDGGQVETEKEWQTFSRKPLRALEDLPEEIRDIILENRDFLPLFDEVFPFDIQDEEDNQKSEEGE